GDVAADPLRIALADPGDELDGVALFELDLDREIRRAVDFRGAAVGNAGGFGGEDGARSALAEHARGALDAVGIERDLDFAEPQAQRAPGDERADHFSDYDDEHGAAEVVDQCSATGEKKREDRDGDGGADV